MPDNDAVGRRMMRSLRHRGPDGEGIRLWPDAALVHTRLSIIDRSAAGAQPMANEDSTVWAIFNGEIYNHRELRRALEAHGHQFRGRSDTEVLPHLWEEYGPELVHKLRGMFALAVYDMRSGTLLLARDRFGIKPLFYAPDRTRVAFASEIGSLRLIPGIDDEPNRQAMADCAALHYIPAPDTAFRGIRALEAGQVLEAQTVGDGVRMKTAIYHRWSVAPDASMNACAASQRAEELLTAAVSQQMESDVPLGSLLSGGIDSSLVSAAAQQASGNLRTFNVQFADPGYDETWAAQAVARHIGSRHETLPMNHGDGTWEHITDLLRHAGQPFADTSLFAAHAVSRLMRRHVAVALSGDGGDEAFGGYDVYWRLTRYAQLQALPRAALQSAATGAKYLARLGRMRHTVAEGLDDLATGDDAVLQRRLFTDTNDAEHASLCRDRDAQPVRRFFERQWSNHLPPGATAAERLSAHATEVNLRLVLANDYLFKVDTASMREGLEVRVPMLDEELVSFGLTLPHRLKVQDRKCKMVLRAIAARRLPAAVAAKAKQGFGIPVDTWVDDAFKRRLRETLLSRSSPLPEFFVPDVYQPWIDAFCESRQLPGMSRAGLYRRAMMLLSVHLTFSSSSTAN